MQGLRHLRDWAQAHPRWVLLGVLLLYGLLHLPWLALPTFNDEAFCYYPAILHQWANGLSLLPSAVPPDLSRGHPLLFSFLYGAWAQAFGSSLLPLRTLSLLLTLGWLYKVWGLAHWLTGPRLAWATLLLLMVQPIVFAQSTLLLPEVLVALCFTAMLQAWLQQRWLAYVLWGAALVWTKETTLALFPLMLLAWLLWQWPQHRRLGHPVLLRGAALTLLPLAIGLSYLLLQKLSWGFWLFPAHRGVMQYQALPERLALLVGPELWGRQGRWLLGLVWLAVPVVRALYRWQGLPMPPWRYPRLPPALLLGMALLLLGYVAVHSPFLVVMRYYLCVLPLFVLGALVLAQAFPWRRFLGFSGVLAGALALYALLWPGPRVDEVNLNYAHQTRCDQAAIAWLAAEGLQQAPIYTQLVMRRKLVYPYNGYTREPFGRVYLHPDAPWAYYVLTADFATRWQWLFYREPFELFLPGTQLVYSCQQGHAWTHIYKRGSWAAAKK